jgi:DNA-binding transcriptional ArsR family regulator
VGDIMLEEFFTKNGIALVKIAKILMGVSSGNRIPKISELSDQLGMGRGTVQVALKRLEETGIIQLESRGHQGTYLLQIDITEMWKLVAFQTLAGAMPLPYSKRYEGLATGLYQAFEEINLPFNLAYMRGADSRIDSLINKRYDFVLISHHAAKKAIDQGKQIEVILNFGTGSYLSAHTLLFDNEEFCEIKNGMKIGVDSDSIDQRDLTYKVCEGKQVDYIELPYTQILSNLQIGQIDACVFNGDEIEEKYINIKRVPIPQLEQKSNTEAVVLVRKEDTNIFKNLFSLIDVSKILTIQNHVMDGKQYPKY